MAKHGQPALSRSDLVTQRDNMAAENAMLRMRLKEKEDLIEAYIKETKALNDQIAELTRIAESNRARAALCKEKLDACEAVFAKTREATLPDYIPNPELGEDDPEALEMGELSDLASVMVNDHTANIQEK